MKDLVSSLLDLDIHIWKSNMIKKRLFNYAVEAIKYYLPVRSPTLTESIFFLLARLSPLVGPPKNSNHTKNESYSRNNNLSNGVDINNRVDIGNGVDISNGVDDEISWTDELSSTNLNRTKSESCGDHCNIQNEVSEEIPFIEEI